MSKKSVVIIQKGDIKSASWSREAQAFFIEMISQKGSPITAPLFLCCIILKKQNVEGYIFRYLNDYPSLGKTVLRAFAEIATIILCKLFHIKIFWICHNVDRESDTSYPVISNLRRKIVSFFSKKIFVMDELLVSKATEIFPKYAYKIEDISFGILEERLIGNGDTTSSHFLEKQREVAQANNKKFLCTLCTGSLSSKKSLHFQYLIELINKASESDVHLCAIVAGNALENLGQLLVADYRKVPNILVFDKYTTFSFEFIRANVDFYFRSYDDFSVPFTVYEAGTVGKPILAQDFKFLPHMLEHYDLGVVVDKNLEGLPLALNRLSLDNFQFDTFFGLKRWSSLGEKLQVILNQ